MQEINPASTVIVNVHIFPLYHLNCFKIHLIHWLINWLGPKLVFFFKINSMKMLLV